MNRKQLLLSISLLLALAGGSLFLTGFQNAGNTGTATIAQQVTYTGAGGTKTSQIFRNVGQSAHYLSYCLSSYQGTIALQASFDGTTNWVPLGFVTYPSATTTCNVLQAGGYYQSIRSVVGISAGTITAYYSASSGPISFAPTGLSNLGQTAPPVCNNQAVLSVASGASGTLFPAGDTITTRIFVCAFMVSFDGATGAGSVIWKDSSSTCATTTNTLWEFLTTATTPQVVSQSASNGALFQSSPGANSVCVANTSGATAAVSMNYTDY